MKTLHFDCFAGISGDMTLGALVDLGVSPDALRAELQKLKLEGWSLDFVKDERCGITGTRAVVADLAQSANTDASRSCDHRHWSDIRALIEQSDIAVGAKKTALAIFSRIAEAEAQVHGVAVDDVAFHEVGAIDSIIDVVGAAICLDMLKPDRITASEIELGGGTVSCAHGILPVPAPATLKLVAGLPVKTGGFDKEMTTPTGAAILATCVDQFATRAVFTELQSAYGIGQRKMDKPNVLRVSWRKEQNAASQTASAWKQETLVMLETNIDDMSGEAFGFLMERLFEAGALDATFSACVMKKSRPGTIVRALASPDKLDAVRKALFKYSSAIGFREIQVNRVSLPREETIMQSEAGSARIKTICIDGEKPRAKIEYEDRARIARAKNISLSEAEEFIWSTPSKK